MVGTYVVIVIEPAIVQPGPTRRRYRSGVGCSSGVPLQRARLLPRRWRSVDSPTPLPASPLRPPRPPRGAPFVTGKIFFVDRLSLADARTCRSLMCTAAEAPLRQRRMGNCRFAESGAKIVVDAADEMARRWAMAWGRRQSASRRYCQRTIAGDHFESGGVLTKGVRNIDVS